VSSLHEFAAAALADKMVDESPTPLGGGQFCQEEQLNIEDVRPFDDSVTPDVYGRSALLSLADMASIDTRCIGWLLAVHKRFREAGGKLVVHSIRPQSRRLLDFLRLDLVLHIAEDEAAALRLLRASETVGTD